MKKLWGRILFLSALIVMMLTVNAFADNTIQYCASTFTFKGRKTESSSAFTVASRTNITVHVKIYNNSSDLKPYTQTINTYTNLYLRNVASGEKFYLTDKTITALEYDVHFGGLEAGTYTFCVENNQDYWFQMYFRVVGTPGIDVIDNLELTVGQTQNVSVTLQNLYGGYMSLLEKWDVSPYSPNPNAATVTNIQNYTGRPSVVSIYGREEGITYINLYGADGSTDQIKVTVTGRQTVPTLLYNTLKLQAGEIVYNDVLNTVAPVTWTSANPSIAKVERTTGKITAISYGNTRITAETQKGGVTYKLVCTVTVQRAEPEFLNFKIAITSLNKKKGRVKVRITNLCGTNMTVYKTGKMLNYPDFQIIRSLKMANASVVTIPDGATKVITFNIGGAKLTEGNKYNYAVRLRMNIDGYVYFARATADENMGQYILKSNVATNNWLFSYIQPVG